jgi:hypothetical protein
VFWRCKDYSHARLCLEILFLSFFAAPMTVLADVWLSKKNWKTKWATTHEVTTGFRDLLREKVFSLALPSAYSLERRTMPLRDAAITIRRPVVQRVGELYTPIGLFNWGRGLFHKAPRDIDEMGDSDSSYGWQAMSRNLRSRLQAKAAHHLDPSLHSARSRI